MRILVCGGRNFGDCKTFYKGYRTKDDELAEEQYQFAYKVINDIVQNHDVIVSIHINSV